MTIEDTQSPKNNLYVNERASILAWIQKRGNRFHLHLEIVFSDNAVDCNNLSDMELLASVKEWIDSINAQSGNANA